MDDKSILIPTALTFQINQVCVWNLLHTVANMCFYYYTYVKKKKLICNNFPKRPLVCVGNAYQVNKNTSTILPNFVKLLTQVSPVTGLFNVIKQLKLFKNLNIAVIDKNLFQSYKKNLCFIIIYYIYINIKLGHK